MKPLRDKLLRDVAWYWNCELFLLGLMELGLLTVHPQDYDCELFQIGLKELGLAA